VRTLREATEDEVIAAFLGAEIESDRHDRATVHELNADRRPWSIVGSPNLDDPEENAYRRSLLGRVRGWGRDEGMFQGFPDRVDWAVVALIPPELAEVRYIAWDWWLERSGGTWLATEHARRIRAGEFPGDPESGLRYHEPIARRLRDGPPVPSLIVVRDVMRPDFMVLVEGHVRLTAFFLFPEMLPPELDVYLGTAEGLRRSGLYG
jgi:hypothetical protein